MASRQLALINISAAARQRGHGHAEECWRRASREVKGNLPLSLPWQPRWSGWRAARGAGRGSIRPRTETPMKLPLKIPLWERDGWAAPGGMPWAPHHPDPLRSPAHMGLEAPRTHPDPVQLGGLQTPSPSSLPMQWSSSPQDSGQSWLLLPSPGKGPGCARCTGRRPSPRPHAPRPPCMGASRPCLVLTERAKRLQIPAPSTYFLHAGECVLQQVRVGQDLVGRRRRICVSAPCFMALESGRWRQPAASSAWSSGPARPCCMSRTPRSEAVRDRDPPLGPDPWTPMTLGLTPCCPQSQQHPSA